MAFGAKTVVRDTDNGAKALEARVRRNSSKGNGPRLHIGIVGANATIVHEAPENADGTPGKKTSITMSELGEIFEFGLGTMPERSWLRAFVDENATRIVKMFVRVGEQVAAGKLKDVDGLNLIGLQLVGEIKQRIQAGIAPELAASTLKKKGADKTIPLINTSQWIGSINHMVTGRVGA